MAERPLEGIRIVVTRPEAKSLADQLESLGAEVSLVPLIEIRPAEDHAAAEAALERLDGYDWVVFTSVNAVAVFAPRLGGLAGPRVAAVGPVTADRIVAHFGLETLEVIDTAPERLDEVPGVGAVRAALIARAWEDQRQIKEIMLANVHRVP